MNAVEITCSSVRGPKKETKRRGGELASSVLGPPHPSQCVCLSRCFSKCTPGKHGAVNLAHPGVTWPPEDFDQTPEAGWWWTSNASQTHAHIQKNTSLFYIILAVFMFLKVFCLNHSFCFGGRRRLGVEARAGFTSCLGSGQKLVTGPLLTPPVSLFP